MNRPLVPFEGSLELGPCKVRLELLLVLDPIAHCFLNDLFAPGDNALVAPVFAIHPLHALLKLPFSALGSQSRHQHWRYRHLRFDFFELSLKTLVNFTHLLLN